MSVATDPSRRPGWIRAVRDAALRPPVHDEAQAGLSRHRFSGQVDQVELVDLERKSIAPREEKFLAAVS